jgi:DUF4097 and DUF4098 domain-containing protein YvlB
MRTNLLLTALRVSVLALLPVAIRAQTSERVALSGNEVAIYNLVGKMKVVGGAGSAVVVNVTRGGKDASQLRVEHGPRGGRETFRVIYPSGRISYPDMSDWGHTSLRVADDGTFNDNDNGYGGDRVEISSRNGGLDAHADLTVEVPAGKRVDLHLAAGDVNVTNVNGDIYVDVNAADVTTSGTKGILSLDTGSGTVSVTNASGNVTLDTGSGSVSLKGIRGDRLSVDAGSGRLTADDIQVQSLNMDLGSGGARVTKLGAQEIKLDSGSGGTELDLLTDIRMLDVDSGSGGVTIWIPASFGAKVDIDAGSGGINMDVPVQVTRWESDHLVGTIGDGQGTVKIDAGSGGVRFKKRP